MLNHISLGTLNRAFTNAMQGNSFTAGADHRTSQTGTYHNFKNWIFNKLGLNQGTVEKQTKLNNAFLSIVKLIVATPTDGSGNFKCDVEFVVDDHPFRLRQDGDKIVLQDDRNPAHTCEFGGMTAAKFKGVMLNAFLLERGQKISNFPGEFNDIGDVNFSGTGMELDRAGLQAVIARGGDLGGARLEVGTDVAGLDLGKVRMDNQMACELIKAGANSTDVLSRYIATEHGQGHTNINMSGFLEINVYGKDLEKTPMLDANTQLTKADAIELFKTHVDPKLVFILYLEAERARGNINIDISDFDLSQIDLKNINIQGVELNSANMQQAKNQDAVYNSTSLRVAHGAVTKLQANFRRHTQTLPAAPDAARTIRGDNGEILAFQIKSFKRNYYPGQPPKIEGRDPKATRGTGDVGFAKAPTHMDKNWIVLTQHDQDSEEQNSAAAKDNIRFILDNNLTHINYQTKIRKGQYLTQNLGNKNFSQLMQDKNYPLSYQSFGPAASNLDSMHNAGYIHGDLNSRNFMEKDGEMHIIDLDTMARFDKDGREFHKLKQLDQLRFMGNLFEAYESRRGGEFEKLPMRQKLAEFGATLPCSDTLKEELINFMAMDDENSEKMVLEDLSRYLNPWRQ